MPEPIDFVGETLGSFRVVRAIGEGGMGRVYLGEHTLLGKQAAIKVLLPEFSNDAEIVGRFFNEARSATLIRHPGIVEVFDFGKHASGSAYIIMEFLDGESLSTRVHRERISYERTGEIARQICAALAAAHAKGIVHRDLKPDNVYLVPDAALPYGVRVKLLDFGIAKLSGNKEGVATTRTGTIMGTPLYMAPEQCKGAGAVGFAADLYSLGCVVFEMLSGRPPFQAEGVGSIIAAHIYEKPPAVRELVPNVPAVLATAVSRLLEKDPANRYASAIDTGVAFGAHPPRETATDVGLPPTSSVRMATAPNTTLSKAAVEVSDSFASLPKKRRLMPAVVAIVILVGAGFLGLRLSHKPESVDPPAVPRAAAPPIEKPVVAAAPVVDPLPIPVRRVRYVIRSQPSGADVLDAHDDSPLGQTPYSVERDAGEGELGFLVRRAGYADELIAFPADRDGEREARLRKKRAAPHGEKRPIGGVLDPFGKD